VSTAANLTAPGAAQGVATTAPNSRWLDVHPALGISLMDHLWNRLDGAYPKKWRESFPSQQSIDNWRESWVEAFEEEFVSPEEVKSGLKECRRRFPWPPSCAEFIQVCKPYMDAVAAYHEAVDGLQARGKGEAGVWSHPAIFWATTGLSRDLMEQTHAQVKDRWAAALKRQLTRGAWEPIPAARVLLPPPEREAMSKESAEQFLRNVGAAGIGQAPKEGIDHKRWARVVLERHAKGDAAITLAVLHDAQEALGMRGRSAVYF
jgi:hypothetical protein